MRLSSCLTRSAFLRPLPLPATHSISISHTCTCQRRRPVFPARFRLRAIASASSSTSPSSSSDTSINTSSTLDTPKVSVGYDFTSFESKWQRIWSTRGDFTTPPLSDLDTSKPKFYALDMFPYPSGAGLHVGHPEGYTATDILSRYHRKLGHNVLHPMGWDAFGLPAEQYALSTGTHPSITTAKNIDRFRSQLQALGFSYDWGREVSTTDPGYYKWTQWIFLKLWERGLAYLDDKPVNWCPALGTVLANEEVIDGLSERGGHHVERRQMKQWVLKITAYAERLLEDLDDVDWPENVKDMQRNWIGKSVGAELVFNTTETDVALTVFTTRPETICGVSYVVVAPELPNLFDFVSEEQRQAVRNYVEVAARKSDRERTGEGAAKTKTGVWTGATAINPMNGDVVPVWVSDFVLGSYGTGAVMSVPAHDTRDYEFATTFQLPIKPVIKGKEDENSGGAFTGDGEMIGWGNAGGIQLDGMRASEAKEKLLNHLEGAGLGKSVVNYKLRDWLFSRQRYWGEPFPIIFVDDEPQAVPESDLPIKLPDVTSFKPSGTGDSPLANVDDWVNAIPGARRETNTMPQWAGSCWYYLRFIDPDNVGAPVDKELEKYWMPVDLYVGGVEHAVLHLLYARFWHKVLYDIGVVSTKEPFQRLVNQGMILGEVEHTVYRVVDSKEWVSASDVDVLNGVRVSDGVAVEGVNVAGADVVKVGDVFELKDATGVRVASRAHKMSKSRGNVVNPDSVIEQYGADALRCYLMFMGPLEQVKPWGTKGVHGMCRFLARVWRLIVDDSKPDSLNCQTSNEAPTAAQLKVLHQTIKRVTDDVEGLRFNTALAGMMEYVNEIMKWEKRPRETLTPLLSMLGIFAPHIAEELWSRMGETESLAHARWPEYRKEFDVEDSKLIVVQVNGKIRSKMQVGTSATKEDILQKAKETESVAKYLTGVTIRKEIYVPNKLVNLVVSQN